MDADAPVLIEVQDPWDRIPAEESVLLRLVIHRPAHHSGPVIIPFVSHADSKRVHINTDLFNQAVTLRPGENLVLTLGVSFRSTGPANLCDFYVQANNPADQNLNTLVRLPERPVRVLPSLARQIEVRVERICAYDDGVKVEVFLKNKGPTIWDDFQVEVGPARQVRAGVVRHRRAKLEPNKPPERFEIVLKGDAVELTLAATAEGERIEHSCSLPVPVADSDPKARQPYRFLEPRALTTDRVNIQTAEGEKEVRPNRGYFPVYGGGEAYLVTIYPSDPQAQNVNLLRAAGQVEVERMKSEGRAWQFLIKVLESSILTQSIRLYYDVEIPGRSLRGELYVSVRPSSGKLWAIAATAGAALTVHGLAAVVPSLLNPEHHQDNILFSLGEMIQRHWGEWIKLASIPLIRVGLWGLDLITRPFRLG
jgi:hypothetical protein